MTHHTQYHPATRLRFRRGSFALVVVLSLFLAACSAAAGALDGTNWQLESYAVGGDLHTALPEVETSMTFDSQGQVSGNVGCNSFSGSYTEKDSQIILDAISSTLMACDEARMQQESAVFGILSGTLDFSIDGNLLKITKPDGSATLVFRQP